MNVSLLGKAWTAHSEGCKLTAYPDNGAFSVGYGHRGVPEGLTCTPEQAEEWLTLDLENARLTIEREVAIPLTQGQFDALSDFIYNVGSGEFQKSTLLKLLRMGDTVAACRELYWEDGEPHGWIYADGKINEGLIARRKGEQILWNGGNPL